MRDWSTRRPGAVPDDGAEGPPRWGPQEWGSAQGDPGLDGAPVRWDTDADGHPDTLLTSDGADLLVLTDLDGDGLADRILRIGPDASVHELPAHEPPGHQGPHPVVDEPVAGHAPAAHRPWGVLLGRLLGLDP